LNPTKTRRSDSPSGAVGKLAASGGQSLPVSKTIKTMKQTVSEFQFVDSFRHAGRESQFTVPARRALFAHLEELEDSCGTEFELDPVGICCEWREYPSALDAAKDYGFKDGIDSKDETPLEWLQNRTQVVEFEGGIVVQAF
jgi:hypothetical protein